MPTPSNTNTTTQTHDTADTATPAAQAPAQQHTAGVAVNAQIPPLPALIGDPKRLLWLGGLVAVGALGVLEWPVVAAVGVGSYVAEQFAKNDTRQGQQSSQP